MLNINQAEYLASNSQGAGVVLVIHPSNRMPFPEDEGYFAAPNHITTIEFSKASNERSLLHAPISVLRATSSVLQAPCSELRAPCSELFRVSMFNMYTGVALNVATCRLPLIPPLLSFRLPSHSASLLFRLPLIPPPFIDLSVT